MGIEPYRKYQEEDIPWFLTHKRSLVLYDPRMGKTVVMCSVMAQDPECKVIIVACPKNALFVWSDHIKEWFAHIAPHRTLEIRHCRGKGAKAAQMRKDIYLKPRSAEVTVYITTHGSLVKDYQFLQLPSVTKILSFDTVIGDEVHRNMRNRKNVAVKIFNWLTHPRTCKRFHALSGTLAGKGGPGDFWPLLHMCNPKEFSSYWKLMSMFHHVIVNHFGQRETVGLRNMDNWGLLLKRYARRRFRELEASQMPKVQRQLIKIEPTDEQVNLIRQLTADGFVWTHEDQSNLIITATSMETVLRRRQILVCPKIFDDRLGIGAAMEELTEILTDPDIADSERHIVIFTPFRQAMNHFEKHIREHITENVWQLYGSMEPELQQQRIKAFKETKGIIICSTKYAQAFSLDSSILCYHIGYEWDPAENKQAEDRLVPQVGHYPIGSMYFAHIGLDEDLAERINIRNELVSLTIGNAKSMLTSI